MKTKYYGYWLIAMRGQNPRELVDSSLWNTPEEAARTIDTNRMVELGDGYVPLQWDRADDLWEAGDFLIIFLECVRPTRR